MAKPRIFEEGNSPENRFEQIKNKQLLYRRIFGELIPVIIDGNTVYLRTFQDKLVAATLKDQLFEDKEFPERNAKLDHFFDDVLKVNFGGSDVYYSTGYNDPWRGRTMKIGEALKLQHEIKKRFPDVKTKVIESLIANADKTAMHLNEEEDAIYRNFDVYTSPVLTKEQHLSLEPMFGHFAGGGSLNSFQQLADKYK